MTRSFSSLHPKIPQQLGCVHQLRNVFLIGPAPRLVPFPPALPLSRREEALGKQAGVREVLLNILPAEPRVVSGRASQRKPSIEMPFQRQWRAPDEPGRMLDADLAAE